MSAMSPAVSPMLILVYALLLGSAWSEPSDVTERDRVTSLPGAPEKLPTMYSGYLSLRDDPRRQMFYTFVLPSTLANTSTDDPIIMWTNGGPGCSGLLGFLAEQGPLRPVSLPHGSVALTHNEWSWTQLRSMLFLEQPLGVGFSFSDLPGDKFANDSIAAEQMREALLAFKRKFPRFKHSPFVLSSESYGGKYIPTLANRILDGNDDPEQDSIDISGGLLIGNPYVGPIENEYGIYTSDYGHGIVPFWLYRPWLDNCAGTHPYMKNASVCSSLEQAMQHASSNVNPYALDYPLCRSEQSSSLGVPRASDSSKSPSGAKSWVPAPRSPEPCTEELVPAYLNRRDVQDALGAYPTRWVTCAEEPSVYYNRTELMAESQYLYKRIVKRTNGMLPMLLYSGDDDSVCAPHGTMWWMHALADDESAWNVVKERTSWKPWFAEPKGKFQARFGGFYTMFSENVTFCTVHFGGHEVPLWQPERSLSLASGFLDRFFFTQQSK